MPDEDTVIGVHSDRGSTDIGDPRIHREPLGGGKRLQLVDGDARYIPGVHVQAVPGEKQAVRAQPAGQVEAPTARGQQVLEFSQYQGHFPRSGGLPIDIVPLGGIIRHLGHLQAICARTWG